MSRIIRALLRILSNLIHKGNSRIVFISNPDFSDNTKSLYDYLIVNHPSFECTWLCKNRKMSSELSNRGASSVEERTLKGFFEFSRAKVIITSHNNLLPLKSKRQIYVNLWHGVPLKTIGHTDRIGKHKRDLSHSLNHKTSITVSTSDTASTVLGSCFHISANHLFVTGLPRNDDLFYPVSHDELSGLLSCDVKRYERIAFYMPTFRQGYLERTEGKTLERDNVFRFEEFNLEAFQEHLAQKNILFICKLHPFEEKLFKNRLDDLRKSIVFLSSEDLIKRNMNLYRVLGIADLLITDYSSVYFDYLLLNKPMVFTPTDLEEYEKKRGFLLEPYGFWTPGPKATNQQQLQDEILRSLEDPDYYRKERETINNIINHYKDDRSCERVTQLIMEKLNRKK